MSHFPQGVGIRCFLIFVLLLAALAALPAAPAEADTTCNRWAATDGDDGNPGTEAAPFRSMGKLVASLTAGQVGCLPAGETFYGANSAVDGGYGIANAGGGTVGDPISITSGPGAERAVFKGQQLGGATHDVVLTDLAFAGKYYANGQKYGAKGVHLLLFGDRITVADNDITDPMGICIQLGNSNPDTLARVDDAVISRNRIHGCGMDPSINWVESDSGAHGMYIQNSLRTLVSENVIYGNRTRGVQLYPLNDGVVVRNNLFYANATQVNIGSEDAQVSRNTVVEDNLMAARVTDWAPGKNESQVFGNLPTAPDLNNEVSHNCYDPGDVFIAGNNVTDAGGNVAGAPVFEGAAGGDFRLSPGSPCTGFGPASIQPPTELDPRPDAWVASGGTDPVGDDVYNLDGTGQTAFVDVERGDTATVAITLQNDSAGPDDLLAAGVPTSPHPGFAHAYRRGGVDVTDAVDGGSLLLPDVPASATRALTFQVSPGDGTDLGETATYFLHLYHAPLGTPPVKDVVKIVVTVVGRQHDLTVRSNAGGAVVGAGVYDDGSAQTLARRTRRGMTARFTARVVNEGSEDTRITLAGGVPRRGVRGRWMLHGTNVTADLRAGTLLTPSLAPGGAVELTYVAVVRDRARAGLRARAFLTGMQSGAPSDTIRVVTVVRR